MDYDHPEKGDALYAFELSLSLGQAVQVDPMKPQLKPPGTTHLKL